MGESIVGALNPNLEDKMGETAPSNPVLEVSVSFGRFENDSLSWEKWSSFSPNKYLEEVEKCATPGSVAKKAAYFEAHYKKIAARKAELLDQEKEMDNDSSRVNNQTCGDLIEDNGKIKPEPDLSDCQWSDVVVNQETILASEVSETVVDKPVGDAEIMVEYQSSSIEGMKGEAESGAESIMLDKPEEAVSVSIKKEVENAPIGIEDVKELQEKEMEHTTNVKEEKVKLDRPKDSHKITPMNKERNISRIKKKPASPMAKASPTTKVSPMAKASPIMKAFPMAKASPITKALPIVKASPITKASAIDKGPQLSTSGVSKPVPISTPISSSRSSKKIGNGSSLSRSTNLSAGESKKVASKSLHMSLSLGPSSSDQASLTTTRKSLIMEKMADKDIVKRAFKTFQNNYNQLKPTGEEQYPAPKQVPAMVVEQRASTLTSPRKENAGSVKAAGVEKKYAEAAPPSLALKSAEKRKEFSKKSEGNSNAREVERPRLQTKSKEDKEVGINKIRQRLSSKVTSTPGLYGTKKVSKGSLNKDGSKNEMHR